MAPKQEIKKVV